MGGGAWPLPSPLPLGLVGAVAGGVHAVGVGLGQVADLLDLVVHALLQERVEPGAFGFDLGEVAQFGADADDVGMTAVVGQPQLFAVGRFEDDCHRWCGSFRWWVERWGSGWVVKAAGAKTARSGGAVDPARQDATRIVSRAGSIKPAWMWMKEERGTGGSADGYVPPYRIMGRFGTKRTSSKRANARFARCVDVPVDPFPAASGRAR